MKNKDTLQSFFDLEDFSKWKKEWIGMPEYIQDDLEPIQQIIISFATSEDVQEFAELINRKLTSKTKSIWFPEIDNEKPSNYIYVDES